MLVLSVKITLFQLLLNVRVCLSAFIWDISIKHRIKNRTKWNLLRSDFELTPYRPSDKNKLHLIGNILRKYEDIGHQRRFSHNSSPDNRHFATRRKYNNKNCRLASMFFTNIQLWLNWIDWISSIMERFLGK